GELDPLMAFSTLRLQFTQPLDRQTVVYGDGPDATVALLDNNDEVVPAWLVIDGPHLTIDPKEDLTAGQEYRLSFATDAITSVYGETFEVVFPTVSHRMVSFCRWFPSPSNK